MKNETETMIEEFRAVAGTDGLYEISSLGRVRSNIGKGRIRKSAKSPRGYMNIILMVNGKRISTTIHRLMADAFIPNPDPSIYTQVNHINGIKDDNRLENFEWSTPSENMQHARDTGLNPQRGETSHLSKLTEMQVRNIRLFANTMEPKEISRLYDVSTASISAVIERRTWKHVK